METNGMFITLVGFVFINTVNSLLTFIYTNEHRSATALDNFIFSIYFDSGHFPVPIWKNVFPKFSTGFRLLCSDVKLQNNFISNVD